VFLINEWVAAVSATELKRGTIKKQKHSKTASRF